MSRSINFDEQDIFPTPENAGPRPWGKEDTLCIIKGELSLKQLFVKKGQKGGLQFHRLKNECGILISGSLLVRYDCGDGKLRERIVTTGESFHFPPGLVHQEEALEDCVIIEASTPHFNDRVRVESLYGLGKPEGLPTTEEHEIVKK